MKAAAYYRLLDDGVLLS